MSNKTRLEANNVKIDELIQVAETINASVNEQAGLLAELDAAVDALPDAGDGGGVETCTVTISKTSVAMVNMYGTTIVNDKLTAGAFELLYAPYDQSFTVVKGTILAFIHATGMSKINSVNVSAGATLYDDCIGAGYACMWAVLISPDAGDNITILIDAEAD